MELLRFRTSRQADEQLTELLGIPGADGSDR
jgi:hypothetical protein